MGFFAGLALVFLLLRRPDEVRRLEDEAGGDGPPLSRRQRVNVGVTLIVSQMLQVLVVAGGVGLFFVALGALAIRQETMAAWEVRVDELKGTFSARAEYLALRSSTGRVQ